MMIFVLKKHKFVFNKTKAKPQNKKLTHQLIWGDNGLTQVLIKLLPYKTLDLTTQSDTSYVARKQINPLLYLHQWG